MSALGQASSEFENIITVGAVDAFNRRADYSSFGKGLDIVAYGGTEEDPILSTVGSAADLKLVIENLGMIVDEVTDSAEILAGEIDIETSDLLEEPLSDQISFLDVASEKATDFIEGDQSEIDGFFTELNDLITILPEDLQDILIDLELADLLSSLELEDSTSDFGVGEMAGTSVAAAQVTGAISQVWAANPKLSFVQVKRILQETALDLEQPGWDMETGSGLLNLPLALEVARKTSSEVYAVQPFSIPLIWGGEGQSTPLERAANFYGTVGNKSAVQLNRGLNIRSSHGERFDILGRLSAGERPEFDQVFQDDILVKDPNQDGSSNLWYRLADGRGWVSALYVGQIQEIQPSPKPIPIPKDFPVQGSIRETWIKNPQLGKPIGEEISLGNGVTKQVFINGYVIRDGSRINVYQTKDNRVYRLEYAS